MTNLLKTKPLDVLMRQASETGEHSLKRALGPVNLITLGIGAIIGAGIFVLTGPAAAQYAGPAIVLSYVLAGIALRLCRTLLRRIRLPDPHRRLGLHLRLRHAGRDLRLDHRLGPDPGIRLRRGHRGLRLELHAGRLPAGLRHQSSAADLRCSGREVGRWSTAAGRPIVTISVPTQGSIARDSRTPPPYSTSWRSSPSSPSPPS